MENKYKILVLSDIDNSTEEILKTSVNIAKIVDGEIDVFCVKKPNDLVEKESQLSAMRTINESFIKADNKIKAIKKQLFENTKINISHKISFGNLKDEINNHLVKTNPDIVVLGKRKSNILSFLGDNMLSFLLKKHKGSIIITDSNTVLKKGSELSLGVLNDIDQNTNDFTKKLTIASKKPLKSFLLSKNKPVFNKLITDEKDKKVREEGYVNEIDMFLVHKSEKNMNIGRFINNTNCSILFTN